MYGKCLYEISIVFMNCLKHFIKLDLNVSKQGFNICYNFFVITTLAKCVSLSQGMTQESLDRLMVNVLNAEYMRLASVKMTWRTFE